MTAPSLFVALLLCACRGGEEDTGDTGALRPIDALSFPALAPWARPIDDYIEANEAILGHDDFLKDIFDLAVFEDRLFLGYGDANLNLGRNTPIELRYWDTPDSDAVRPGFAVDEEQVDRFRPLGDLLVVPGVDATEDAFLGNAYTLAPGGTWAKSRTLEWAWHVHDAARVGDTLYACGSGGTADDYSGSTVKAYLYRSDDFGTTFTVEAEIPHPAPPGDHRFTHLLVVGETLHVFGYWSDTSSITGFEASRLGVGGLEPIPGMPAFFVTETYGLAEDAGLVGGVRVTGSLAWRTLRLTPEDIGAAQAFEGHELVDAEPLGDGRTLVLLRTGSEYPTPEGPWTFRIGLTEDGTAFESIAEQELEIWPDSVAFWREGLYLGMRDGSVWRAQGT